MQDSKTASTMYITNSHSMSKKGDNPGDWLLEDLILRNHNRTAVRAYIFLNNAPMGYGTTATYKFYPYNLLF